jgi:hypothetical protein
MPPSHCADSAVARAQAAGQPRARLAEHRRAHPAQPCAARRGSCGRRVGRAPLCLTRRCRPRCAGDRFDPLQPRTDSGAPPTLPTPRAHALNGCAAAIRRCIPRADLALLTRTVCHAQAASAVRSGPCASLWAGACETCAPHDAEAALGLVLAVLARVSSLLPCLPPAHAATGRASPTLRRAQASPTSSACRCPRPSRPSTPLASGAAAPPAPRAFPCAHPVIGRMRASPVRRARAGTASARAPCTSCSCPRRSPSAPAACNGCAPPAGPARTLAHTPAQGPRPPHAGPGR